MSHIYGDTFRELHSKLDHLVNVNCFGIMFEFYHSERFLEIDKIYQKFENRHDLITNTKFEIYFDKILIGLKEL